MSETAPAYTPPLFTLSSAVFAERDGKILILKRAVGAVTGGWYLPGGALDPGETIDECARRELLEESGLTATGPLVCVAVCHMHVYGYDSLQVLYAAPCADGEVVISNEHSGYRWIDPIEYRGRYFSEDVLTATREHPELGAMLANIRRAIDAYIDWRGIRRVAPA